MYYNILLCLYHYIYDISVTIIKFLTILLLIILKCLNKYKHINYIKIFNFYIYLFISILSLFYT